MSKSKVKMGFRAKMILSILPVIIIIFIGVSYRIFTSNKAMIKESTITLAEEISRGYSTLFEGELNTHVTAARNYNLVVASSDNILLSNRRNYLNKTTEVFLEHNKDILSFWLDFDKNQCDGLDDHYKNVYPFSKTGRMNIGWNRGTGKVVQDAMDIISELDEEYYTRPKEEKTEVVLEPYYYSYTNNKSDEILETTIAMPIFSKSGEVIGVTGIDISLESIKQMVDTIKPFGAGFAMLVSYSGNFVSVPDNSLLGRSIFETKDFSGLDSVLSNIKAGKSFILEDIDSQINNEKTLFVFAPIKIGKTTTPMSLAIAVPYRIMEASDANTTNSKTLREILIFGLLACVLMTILLFVVSNKLSKPLIKLSSEANKLAEGNLDINIDVTSTDEAGELSLVIKNVSQTLNSLLTDINELINSASIGELDSRGNPENYSGSYKELTLGINKLLDNITTPINLTATYLDRISKGDIPEKISGNYRGKFKEMTDSLNGSISAVGLLIEEINILVEAALSGNLKLRAEVARHNGDYQKIISGVNNLFDAFMKPIELSMRFMQAVASGADMKSITEGYNFKGDFEQIKKNIIQTRAVIYNFANVIDTFVEAVKRGELDKRADTSIFSGRWNELVTGINNIVDGFGKLISESGTVLEIMATGDLTPRINTHYEGKFAEMKNNINGLGQSLSDLIIQLQDTAHTTASASAEISSTADSLAAATQEQSSQTDEVAAAITQMSKTIATNAQNTIHTSEVAKRSGEMANEGAKVVGLTVTKMRDIADVVKQSADNIMQLGESSKKIGEIISVIDDIADQTNLLALNAAIEAARAGEQGRGFAVVADEVRKLAESTAEATKQITEMIKGIQSDTANAVLAMQKGTEEVQSGIELADNAGTSLQHILNGTQELLDMINRIAAASEEQSATSEEISYNIASISKVTAESAHNVEDVAHTAGELARLTDTLSGLIKNFKIDSYNSNHANRFLN